MADAISSQALSELIGSIYDCALDPSRWDQTLPNVMDALDCRLLALTLTDLRHHRFLLLKTVGVEPHQMEQQLSKYVPEIHARLGETLASLPSLDEPHVVSRRLTAAQIEASPYHQECVKPAGIVDIMQFFLMHTPIHLAGFAVSRHQQQGIITDREIELGKLLLPHLRRAVTISWICHRWDIVQHRGVRSQLLSSLVAPSREADLSASRPAADPCRWRWWQRTPSPNVEKRFTGPAM